VTVRVGVDVGGTFTKAVACDEGGAVVARGVVPTTHRTSGGVADGVARVLETVFADVDRLGHGPVAVVSHSTTQAVNALLEGDTAVVGVLGGGHRPDLRRARRRTRVGEVHLAPGRRLSTRHAFLDTGSGLDRAAIERAVRDLEDHGAEVLCASEAYGVEDPTWERMALQAADGRGLPGCAGHELTGLYGLATRTVTAALNASILPTALATAGVVERVVADRGPGIPLLVMRGDGGASGIDTMRRRPLLTAFSGPAASVVGALRHLDVRDAVVVEVGGTSTNVSAIRGGRPVLAYVRVMDRVTSVRSIDVRVAGVAGGSLIRVGRRLGRWRVADAGPRSAHVAGLPYASFLTPDDVRGAEVRIEAPAPGDPRAYVVLEARDGRRMAPTLTCAANALGRVPPDLYAFGDGDASREAFRAVGRLLGMDWESAAEQALARGQARVSAVVREVAADEELARPVLVGLGGGAGALIPGVGAAVGLPVSIPGDAEVISSIGDALSLIRVEVERGIGRPSPDAVDALLRDAEAAAVEAGAAPATLQVETQAVPERGAMRAMATGSLALESGEPGRTSADESVLRVVAKDALGEDVEVAARSDFYTVYRATSGPGFAVVDRHGALVVQGRGGIIVDRGVTLARRLPGDIDAEVRHLGPFSVAPAVRLLRGARLIDLTLFSSPDRVVEAAAAECELAGEDEMVALISRT
jgi:N-methylhydantoinase A